MLTVPLSEQFSSSPSLPYATFFISITFFLSPSFLSVCFSGCCQFLMGEWVTSTPLSPEYSLACVTADSSEPEEQTGFFLKKAPWTSGTKSLNYKHLSFSQVNKLTNNLQSSAGKYRNTKPLSSGDRLASGHRTQLR